MDEGLDEDAISCILDAQLSELTPDGLSDQQIRGLNLICGSELLLAALELIDLRAVSKLVLPNGQSMYEVIGNTDTYHVHYHLNPSCNCRLFVEGVVLKAHQPICAHLLAVRVAEKIGLVEVRHIGLERLLSAYG